MTMLMTTQDANEACSSYSLTFEEDTGLPRCDLFSGSVADSVESFNEDIVQQWYDIRCTRPSFVSSQWV